MIKGMHYVRTHKMETLDRIDISFSLPIEILKRIKSKEILGFRLDNITVSGDVITVHMERRK